MYGKVMSIPDALIERYFTLATDALPAELRQVRERLASGRNPRDLKAELAARIVSMYHSPEAARSASEEFDRMFRKGGAPDSMPEFTLSPENGGLPILKVLTESGLVASKGEARRMVRQGAVRVNGERVENEEAVLAGGEGPFEIQVGKRLWARVHAGS
jgi:tyrosyl-tRNA synthetase